jgi:hypothetical protein
MDPIVIAIVLVVAALVVMVVARRRPGSETGTVRGAPERAEATAREDAAREDAAARARALADDDVAPDEAPPRAAETDHDEPSVAPDRHVLDEAAVADEAFSPDEQDDVHIDVRVDVRGDEPPLAAPEAAPKAAAPAAVDEPPTVAAGEPAPSSRDTCPNCGSPMVERVAKRGPRAGRSFLACTRYPTCRTAVEIEERGASRA